jgi:hypothetical protein
MKKSSFTGLKICLLVMAIFAFQCTFAWGVTGHRVVAEIAQRHLSKKAKKEIKKLIGDQSLAYWANWADFIKSDTTHAYDEISKWHYVDLPGNIAKDSFVNTIHRMPGANLYTQIQAMQQQLSDKGLPIEKRRMALILLIHLVGDLHQPLHVGRDEDQGGNKITVYWFNDKTNLHTVWDTKLVDFSQYSYTEYASALDVAAKDSMNAYTSTSLDDWFFESHVLSDKVYAQSPAESKLSYKYNYIFQKDLDDQLLKGGLRLAKLINESF